MAKYVRSAKGQIVDFELLAIKAQLAATPVPKKVAERKQAVEEKDSGRPAPANPSLDEMIAAAEAASPRSVGRSASKK